MGMFRRFQGIHGTKILKITRRHNMTIVADIMVTMVCLQWGFGLNYDHGGWVFIAAHCFFMHKTNVGGCIVADGKISRTRCLC